MGTRHLGCFVPPRTVGKVIPILQRRQLRFREVKYFVQGYGSASLRSDLFSCGIFLVCTDGSSEKPILTVSRVQRGGEGL